MSQTPQPETVRAPTAVDEPQGSFRSAVEWVVIVVAALTAAILIKTFLIQAFYIPSASMYPTLQNNDRVLVNKLSYHTHPIHRGDIVVFKRPPAEQANIKDLIKRVIGRPGETVQGRNGHVVIDGHQLSEGYLPPGTVTDDFQPITIPPGHYWVMGDNRTNSSDSRVFGSISRSLIVGRAFIRVWPLRRCEQGKGCHSALNLL